MKAYYITIAVCLVVNIQMYAFKVGAFSSIDTSHPLEKATDIGGIITYFADILTSQKLRNTKKYQELLAQHDFLQYWKIQKLLQKKYKQKCIATYSEQQLWAARDAGIAIHVSSKDTNERLALFKKSLELITNSTSLCELLNQCFKNHVEKRRDEVVLDMILYAREKIPQHFAPFSIDIISLMKDMKRQLKFRCPGDIEFYTKIYQHPNVFVDAQVLDAFRFKEHLLLLKQLQELSMQHSRLDTRWEELAQEKCDLRVKKDNLGEKINAFFLYMEKKKG